MGGVGKGSGGRLSSVAQQAAALLAAAEASGDLADRDAAIDQGLSALRGARGDAQLALRLGRALSARYRTTYLEADLDAAVVVLTDAEERDGGPLVQAELARALAQVWEQMEVRGLAVSGDGRSITPERVLAEAERLANAAVAAARQQSPEWADAAHALGVVRIDCGDYPGAVQVLEESVAEDPRPPGPRLDLAIARGSHAAGGDDPRARELLVALAQDLAAPRSAFEAARFHGVWASQRGAWAEAGDAFVRAHHARGILRREQDGRLRIAQWLSEAGPIPSQAACALVRAGRAEEAARALDAGLALNLADQIGVQASAALSDIEELRGAGADEPMLYLAFDAAGGVVIAVPPRGAITATCVPVTRDAIADSQIGFWPTYGAWLATRSPAALRTWMRALSALLDWLGSEVIEPAFELLPPGTEAVVLVPDGVIGLLPLHAAPVAGATLLDHCRVRIAPSARMLVRAREGTGAAPEPTVAIAVGELPGAPPLPHAPAEARAVAAMAQRNVVLNGPAATVHAVEEQLESAGVAHFACHADARFDNPLFSAIFLADAPLTLGRLLQLRLDRTRLAVLSACETAMPEVAIPEEKFSLATGFLHAGAAGVLGTLWAVSDRSTLLLVVRFHELRAELDPCEALRRAQLWLRDATGRELREWLQRQGGELATLMDDANPEARPYSLLFNWAGYTYTGA